MDTYDDSTQVDAFTSFFAAHIPPGEDGLIVNAVTNDSDSDEGPLPYTEVKKTVITMLALPHDASDGDHTVYIDRPDPLTGDISTFALCTLNKKRCPHVRTETMFIDSPVRMFHTGESVVSVTGYDTIEIMNAGYDDSDDESESDSDEENYDYLLGDGEEGDGGSEDSESESDDDEEAPELVGLGGGIGGIPSADEDDSVEEADVSDSDLDMGLGDGGEDTSSDGEGESDDSGTDGDSDSEEGDDDDEKHGGEDGMHVDAFDSDESLDMSDSDDEMEREAMKRRLKNLSTPQPGKSKKQKVEGKAPPASAPPKVNPKVPTNEAEYGAALQAFITQNGGEVKLAQLGSVKRPAAVPKLKKYLDAHKGTFSYNNMTNTVKLA